VHHPQDHAKSRRDGPPSHLDRLKGHAAFRPTLIRGTPPQNYSPLVNEALRVYPFKEALTGALFVPAVDPDRFAELAGVESDWFCALRGLHEDEPLACNADAMRRVAVALGADMPLFARGAIQARLHAKTVVTADAKVILH